LAFQSYEDGIGFDTDYARNNRHIFGAIHAGNVAFIATALDIIKGRVKMTSELARYDHAQFYRQFRNGRTSLQIYGKLEVRFATPR
jgi:hypothetical protein